LRAAGQERLADLGVVGPLSERSCGAFAARAETGLAWEAQPGEGVLVLRKQCARTTDDVLFADEPATIGRTLSEIGVLWDVADDSPIATRICIVT